MYIHDFFQNFLKTFLVCFHGAFTSSVIAPDMPPISSDIPAASWIGFGCAQHRSAREVVVGRFVLARAPLRRCEWPTMATRPVGPTPLFLTLFWEEVTEIASEAEG